MPHPMVIIDPNAPEYEHRGWPPGSCWYDTTGQFWREDRLSSQYRRDHLGKRAPIIVALPMRPDGWTWPFCPDERASDRGPDDPDNGWVVTGELPNISVSPSINAGEAVYHGWITDGVVGDG